MTSYYVALELRVTLVSPDLGDRLDDVLDALYEMDGVRDVDYGASLASGETVRKATQPAGPCSTSAATSASKPPNPQLWFHEACGGPAPPGKNLIRPGCGRAP